jgi:hypothetical protein
MLGSFYDRCDFQRFDELFCMPETLCCRTVQCQLHKIEVPCYLCRVHGAHNVAYTKSFYVTICHTHKGPLGITVCDPDVDADTCADVMPGPVCGGS